MPLNHFVFFIHVKTGISKGTIIIAGMVDPITAQRYACHHVSAPEPQIATLIPKGIAPRSSTTGIILMRKTASHVCSPNACTNAFCIASAILFPLNTMSICALHGLYALRQYLFLLLPIRLHIFRGYFILCVSEHVTRLIYF